MEQFVLYKFGRFFLHQKNVFVEIGDCKGYKKMELIVLRVYCTYCNCEMREEKTYYNKICCNECKIEIKEFRKSNPKRKPKKPIIATCICNKRYRQLNPLVKCINSHVGLPFPENPDQYYFRGLKKEFVDPKDKFIFKPDPWHGFIMKLKVKWIPEIEIANDIRNLSLNVQQWAKNNCSNYSNLY